MTAHLSFLACYMIIILQLLPFDETNPCYFRPNESISSYYFKVVIFTSMTDHSYLEKNMLYHYFYEPATSVAVLALSNSIKLYMLLMFRVYRRILFKMFGLID